MEKTSVSKENIATFQFKGSLFTLTVMVLETGDFTYLPLQLEQLISRTPKFFHNMPIVLDVHKINKSKYNWQLNELINLIREKNIIPMGIRGATTAINEVALSLGLAVMPLGKTETTPPIEIETRSKPTPKSTEKKSKTDTLNHSYQSLSKIIDRPVRSGQQIYAKGGDLIILASVSHGAELLADGNIHVYGTLNGRALAGVNGEKSAQIFCQRLGAELISIAGHYMIKDDIQEKDFIQDSSLRIYLDKDHLQITNLN